jgi:hypothetical protein
MPWRASRACVTSIASLRPANGKPTMYVKQPHRPHREALPRVVDRPARSPQEQARCSLSQINPRPRRRRASCRSVVSGEHEGLDGGQRTRRQIAANRQALYTQSFKLAVEGGLRRISQLVAVARR